MNNTRHLLLAIILLAPAPLLALEMPSEFGPAVRSLEGQNDTAFKNAGSAIANTRASKAVEARANKVARAIEGMVPMPNLTINAKNRTVTQILLRSKTDMGRFGPVAMEVDSFYALGGAPTARFRLKGRQWHLKTVADMKNVAGEGQVRRGRLSVSAGLRQENSAAALLPNLRAAYRIGKKTTLSGGLAGPGRWEGGVDFQFLVKQGLTYKMLHGKNAGPEHRVDWALKLAL